jgi:hypothetical protein
MIKRHALFRKSFEAVKKIRCDIKKKVVSSVVDQDPYVLGHPDTLVRGTDPFPDPYSSIIKQKK